MRKRNIFIVALLLSTGWCTANGFLDALDQWLKWNVKNTRTVFGLEKPATPSVTPKEEMFGLKDLKGKHPSTIDDIVDILLHREERKAQGIDLPRGILFYGPAGTGKTSYAKAMAHDLGMHYIEAAASDFEQIFVGLGAARIRELFAKARAQQPCIIVIDEIDALGNRDSVYGSELNRQIIDALLAEMDGIHSGGDVIVIGTTNEVNLVDKALRRPGRFDYIIEIPLPDEESRAEIIQGYLEKRACEDNLDVLTVARETRGFSGAELKELVKRAAIAMLRNKNTAITQEDLNAGLKEMLKERAGRR